MPIILKMPPGNIYIGHYDGLIMAYTTIIFINNQTCEKVRVKWVPCPTHRYSLI